MSPPAPSAGFPDPGTIRAAERSGNRPLFSVSVHRRRPNKRSPEIPRTENERASVSDMRHATESSPIVSLRETVRSHIPAKVSDSRDPTTHFRSVVPP